MIGVKAVPLLNLDLQALALSVNELQIVVSEFAPFRPDFGFGLSPCSFNRVPIHRVPRLSPMPMEARTWAVPCCSELEKKWRPRDLNVTSCANDRALARRRGVGNGERPRGVMSGAVSTQYRKGGPSGTSLILLRKREIVNHHGLGEVSCSNHSDMSRATDRNAFPVGSRVRLNPAGRFITRSPERQGTVISLSLRFPTTRIVWDGRKTTEPVNISYLELADESAAVGPVRRRP